MRRNRKKEIPFVLPLQRNTTRDSLERKERTTSTAYHLTTQLQPRTSTSSKVHTDQMGLSQRIESTGLFELIVDSLFIECDDIVQ
uniref:Uncharacterized protein n=1 Tax=Setaria digitata TaxID=48799 RepID=A0A915Q0P8_9BILA